MPEILETFFANIRLVLLLLYGVLFYSLGLSILLYSRRYSRLTLTKSLPWLGGFGIVKGISVWGSLLQPFQLEISGPNHRILTLLILSITLAIAFSSLFQFGIELLGPYPSKRRWIRLIPSYVFAGWLIGPFIIGFSLIPNADEWSLFASDCARYFICVPASIISAVGLIHQQRLQIKPLKIPRIDVMVRIAAGSLAAYSLFSGMVVPRAFFFPATVINRDAFMQLFHVPVSLIISIIGVMLFYSIIKIMEIYDIETNNQIREMEEAQLVANERERVARDLHDGVLQQVYASGLLAQSLKKHVAGDQKEEAERLIQTIDQAIHQLREFLPGFLNERTTLDLFTAVTSKIDEAKTYIWIDTHWETQKIPQLSVEQTRHFTALLGEAISNAIRHSKSEKIDITIKYHNHNILLAVRDYGMGISQEAQQGHGLKNMRDRAKLLGAHLEIASEKMKGTLVSLDLPLKEENDEH